MPKGDELTPTEREYKERITAVVKARAAAVRAEREATNQIAGLCVDAKNAGVMMAQLASWVKVLDKQDELRSVSRQAIDQLVAQHQGRPRAPRRKPSRPREETTSKLKLNVF